MSKQQKTNLVSQIMDYKLWVAYIEQSLEDWKFKPKNILSELNRIKKQLNYLAQVNSISLINEKIKTVEQVLSNIQNTIPKLNLLVQN